MNDNKLYAVKDVCSRYSITRKTLFYYDRIGLLKPARRQGSQQSKYYDDEALARLETILAYRQAGLTIAEIRVVIDQRDRKEILKILRQVRERLDKQIIQKRSEISRLDELIRINS